MQMISASSSAKSFTILILAGMLFSACSAARAGSGSINLPYLSYTKNPLYIGLHESIDDEIVGNGTRPVAYSVNPKLPSGLVLDGQTGSVRGRAQSIVEDQNYVVTARSMGAQAQTNLFIGVSHVTPPDLHPIQGFIGNSYSGADSNDPKNHRFIPDEVDGMTVSPNGTVYTNSYYDEGGLNGVILSDGKFKNYFHDLHVWQREGGSEIAVNDRFAVLSVAQRGSIGQAGYPKGSCSINYAIRRYDLSGSPKPYIDPSNPAYVDGDGWDGSMVTISRSISNPAILHVRQKQCQALTKDGGAMLQIGSPIRGLALDNDKLYVSDPQNPIIHVYSVDKMNEIKSAVITFDGSVNSFFKVGRIATILPGRSIAVILKSSSVVKNDQLRIVSTNGTSYGKSQTVVGGPAKRLTTLAFSGNGNRVILGSTDNIYQCVLHTNNRSAALEECHTLHRAEPSQGIVGVGLDSKGRIYVSTNGHGIERSMRFLDTPLGLSYFDLNVYKQEVSPASYYLTRPIHNYFNYLFLDSLAFLDGELYSKNIIFKVRPGFDANHYLHSQLEAVTLDAKRFPDDPRLTTLRAGISVRKIANHVYAFVASQFADGGIAIYTRDRNTLVPSAFLYKTYGKSAWPYGLIHPGSWLWTDSNHDGRISQAEIQFDVNGSSTSQNYAWDVDQKGSIWTTSEISQDHTNTHEFLRFPILRIDSKGTPYYATPGSLEVQKLHVELPLVRVERLIYDALNDTAYLSGYTESDISYGKLWGSVGTTIMRVDHWKNFKLRRTRWSQKIPFAINFSGAWDIPNAPQVYPESVAQAGKYFFVVNSAEATVEAFDSDTGKIIGQPVFAQKQFGGIYMICDFPEAANAWTSRDESVYLSVEDDAHGKNMVYVFPKRK